MVLKQGDVRNVATPRQLLRLPDAVALIVGIVIGAGIFQTPALVASQAGNDITVLMLWLAGGVVSVIGALCYAELATTYPDIGGVYFYLKRAFGGAIAFLFAWARLTVIQTGSITLLAFVFGDYASQLWRLGSFSTSVYAAGVITLLTALNLFGLRQGKWTQNLLSLAKVLGLLLVVMFGLRATGDSVVTPEPTSSGNWGLAMVFVLLSYGGWNEAAYIAAEIQNRQRNILRSLLWSLSIITAIYLLINWAYLQGLGLANMAQSQAVAADLMRSVAGEPGALFISFLIAISTLGAINATIFTGARTNYALGKDFALFGFMGRWQPNPSTPSSALLVQAAMALGLVILGTFTRKGFETMVDYTAPVFWFFFLLSGISLIVLRTKDSKITRPFPVPLYPLTPILFCMVCGYLLYSSLVYTNIGAMAGVGVVATGIPFLIWNRYQ
ncbi:MAG: APC family permease [Trichormus sp.]